MTVAKALGAAAALGLARLDAQLLLLHSLGRTDQERAWLLAHDGDRLDDEVASKFLALCRQRASGEPLAYLVGHQEFFGLRLTVDARVLVPRADTEILVEWALALASQWSGPRVIDLGCGSGAIALAIKNAAPAARVEASDASADALQVAAANARALSLDIELRRASWLEGATGLYDLIVSNPPYIAQDDPHLPALRHEPLQALAAGADGLQAIRVIVRQARERLRPGGCLLLEHGWDQAGPVRGLLADAGFADVGSRRDLAGIERCSGGKWLELG